MSIWEPSTLSRCHLSSPFHVHRYQSGNSGLLHRHAQEVVRHLYGLFVVCDYDELHVVRHFADEFAEPDDVGVVQGRVHLVQEADGTRIELEDGEDERHRGHRLLASRELVNRRSFARRPGH